MTPKFILIPLFLLSLWTHAQNLVPNPSFEDTACTFIAGDETYFEAAHWYNPNDATPDYYGIEPIPDCVPSIFAAVPYGEWQLPHSGSKMVAIFAAMLDGCSREYLQIELYNPLILDSTYCVSFFVSLSNRSQACTDCMGIYFSENEFLNLTDHCEFGVFPQIANPYGVLLDDTLGWTEISGIYTAVGDERYLTIGNLLGDEDCMIEPVNGNDPTMDIAYYFIDDVNVTPCPVITSNDNFNNRDNLSVYPVPARETLSVLGNETGILRIYDIAGHMLYSASKTQKEIQINISEMASGVYLLQFNSRSGHLINRKIIKE